MERLKNILVASAPGRLDAVSLRRVGKLAAANDARVTVLDVVEALPRWRRVVNVEGRDVDVEAMLLHGREDQLRHFIEVAGLNDAEVVVKAGKPLIEVIRRVLADGCDLVIVADPAASKGEITGVGVGVLQLLRKCPVPVWVMRPTRARKLRILALVDPDPGDPVRDGLNDLVLELATSMSRRENGELHVAHAWSLPGEGTLGSSSFLATSPAELEMMVQAVAVEHETRFRAVMDRHDVAGSGGHAHLVKGEPGDVLPALAARLKSNLIVLGTVARTGLSGFFMGNTAETILRTVDSSVLALKPEGFVSPVQPDIPSEGSSR